MARTTLLGRLSWRAATLTALREETPTARTLVLKVPGWPGHDAGQHLDVRLTAADGYSTARSYSIASAPAGDMVEITIEDLPDGEVSPYLTKVIAVGDQLEIRGPLGGWFVWRSSQTEPVQLIAGGSGLVPLMAMLRTRAATNNRAPFRLLYSVRSPEAVLYAGELQERATRDNGLTITQLFTRVAPAGSTQRPQRINAESIQQFTFAATITPTCYVCGPTSFVEVAADLLRSGGHDASRIRTERFGPTGGIK